MIGIIRILENFISQPTPDEDTRIRLRWLYIWFVISFIIIVFLTLLSFVFGIWLLVKFGIVMLIAMIITLGAARYFHNFDIPDLFLINFNTLWAFVIILKLGGIPYCHGLIFVGFNTASSTILNNRRAWSIQTFSLYALTIIVAGIAQPYLKVPDYFSPSLNILYYTMNVLWMSGTVLFFILNYLKDKNLAQEKEKKQKQEMDEFKSHLYTNITHEFRTPLTLIQGMATEIQDNPKLSAERASHMILRNSRKLLKLVNQMLALSKLETGIEKANYIQSDIIAYLKYCIESFYSATEAKGIRLKFKTSFNNYVVDFDPEKLESIMTNLISNAIKHTEEDGIIDIVPKKKEAKNGNNMFEIKISDSGVGIDKDKLSKIFDRFYQADEALDHQSVGSGVGLTIVREYIHLMGGIIEVESKVGEGSEFTISLPVSHEAPLADSINVLSAPRSESNITHESIVHIANTNAPRLLIVEDNPDLVSFLQALLGIDYQIITASNGEEGLKQAFDKIPDIIISDVMMPKMDGFSFLKQIKNDIRTSHIPVIMLTAKVDMKSRLEGLESGADAYLSKPFNKQELFVRLRKLLELREHLQQRYSGFEIIPETTETRIQKEDEFINNVKTIIQEDLSNEHINLDDLYKQMGMSRSKFYRKFSALTNMGIHKYIRNYRLHVARKILLAGTLNVSQTAAEVGYSNISYFSRIFKEEFGINPSQIKPSGT